MDYVGHCSLIWSVVSFPYISMCFSYVVVDLIMHYAYFNWTGLNDYSVDWLLFIMHVRILAQYILLPGYNFCSMFKESTDLSLIVKGLSGGICIPNGTTLRGKWFYLLLRGLLSSCWNDANFSFLGVGSLDIGKFLW